MGKERKSTKVGIWAVGWLYTEQSRASRDDCRKRNTRPSSARILGYLCTSTRTSMVSLNLPTLNLEPNLEVHPYHWSPDTRTPQLVPRADSAVLPRSRHPPEVTTASSRSGPPRPWYLRGCGYKRPHVGWFAVNEVTVSENLNLLFYYWRIIDQ